jgi:hypothetical protein
MAKDGKKKKVHSRHTPKYTTSDDEGSSSDEIDDLTSLFANITKDQKKKINELIEIINEKDDLLECQEDLLVKENKKFVKLKKAYALEVEKCENLSKELRICNDSISCLRIENNNLIAKIEELNVCKPSTSTTEHDTICTRCICWGRASVRRRSHTKKQLRLKSSPRDGRRSLFMELRRFKPT